MVTTIIKPTRDCNLACKYCYTELRDTGEMMDEEIAFVFMEKLRKFEENSEKKIRNDLIWHGGEPLLMGLPFYERIVEKQKELKGNFRNSIQTNGTLLNETNIKFFLENHFSIGLSLDGPKHLNDKTRIYKDGSSCFGKIMESINLMKKYEKRVGVISVINSANVEHLDELIEFFQKEGLSTKLNPLIPSGLAKEHKYLGISASQYGTNMANLFKKWFDCEDKNYTKIDTFIDIIKSIFEDSPYGCLYQETCQDTFLSLSPNGDLYPCGRFDGIEDFKIGNILEMDIEEVMKSPIKKQFNERYQKLKTCKSCEYTKLCHGGCVHNAYLSGDLNNPDIFCSAYKKLFKVIKEELVSYFDSIKEENEDGSN